MFTGIGMVTGPALGGFLYGVCNVKVYFNLSHIQNILKTLIQNNYLTLIIHSLVKNIKIMLGMTFFTFC